MKLVDLCALDWSEQARHDVRLITIGVSKEIAGLWASCTNQAQRDGVEKMAESLLKAKIRARLLADRPDVGGPSMSVDDGWRS